MNKYSKSLIALIIFLLTACTSKNEVKNPMKEYSSLDEINEIAKSNIISPLIEGKKDEIFFILDNNTASYSFKINDYYYNIRACRNTSIDMSGIFINGKPAFEDCSLKKDYKETDKYKTYRYIIDSCQYVITVENKSKIDKETFSKQCEEIRQQILESSTTEEVKNLVGFYQDSASQRASAEVSLLDVDEILISISWSASASETDEWTINAKIQNNKAYYESIIHTKYNQENSEELSDYEEGYFEIQDGKLLWTGSGNPQTNTCTFEKIQ